MMSLSVRWLHKPVKRTGVNRKPHVLLLPLLLLLWTPAMAGTLSIISSSRWVTVAYVYDGDTFRTTDGERIRLLGINTPEVGHHTQAAEAMSNEASARLNQLIGGENLRLAFDSEKKDKYGRTLAQVYLRDGRWINTILVHEGLAHVYTFEPNHRWTEKLLRAERLARSEKIGIWTTSRFRLIPAERIKDKQIGQFRLVSGEVKHLSDWNFKLGSLHVSVPRKYRPWFKQPLRLKSGQAIIVRGLIRTSRHGKYFLALHSPFDLER